ncbi:MAG: acetolactate synthase [Candidatus Kerfeldbacteria bacterium RIFCSPHIGHO2_12_FULL_48_17]|uniref:Acetolactate synthase n=1 Tax=Candidatus Kerfeldbacteria bacterium RIFCSPHIGHO2_12_FULL_48_17 TaxID=1798542 RepID=A0A1G2B701_9BACT|nr:MAG: acetolactate synthase [Candidatus Kerfeldbacteria bacterium RIFCSPHIGHO2_12_FULL_48_17]
MPQKHSKSKGSNIFIRALENEGVSYIFGVPGEENLDFLNSLAHSGIQLITTRHEQSAGFMAATIGRLTGKAGVALSTLGPGATNLATPAAYATLGGMPMMMITGQKPIKRSKQGHFQIIETVNFMKPITKYTAQIVNAGNIPSRVREAMRLAEEERPGAVHLELPEDVACESTEAEIFPVKKVRRPVAEAKAIAQAASMITTAHRPLILIGAGANRKLTSKMLREFIDATGIPFFNTQMGKGVVDEQHPLFLGTAALSAGDYVHHALEKADLIINVGHDVVEKPPFIMQRGSAQVIHMNFFTAKVDDIYFPQLEVVGDIANAVWQLKELVKPQPHWDFEHFLRVKTAFVAHVAETADDARFPMIPQRIVADVRRVMGEEDIVTLDNGMYKIWFARQYQARRKNTLLLDNALATMGAGLPSGMAAKLVMPERRVLVVAGDGGFMMNSQELETAVRLKLDITVLVLVDRQYGMIRWKQAASGFTDFGLDFGNPDFVKYAAAYGAHGHRVSTARELVPLLEKTFVDGGVHVVELPIDYSENERVLNQLSAITKNI